MFVSFCGLWPEDRRGEQINNLCMYVMTHNLKHEQRNQTFDFPPNLPASHPASLPAKRRIGLFYPRSASLTLSRSIWASLALSVRPCLSEALWVSLDLSRSTSMYVCMYVRHLLRRYHGKFLWYVLGLCWLQGTYVCTTAHFQGMYLAARYVCTSSHICMYVRMYVSM